MDIRTVCPKCQLFSHWPPEFLDKEARCPRCLEVFQATPTSSRGEVLDALPVEHSSKEGGVRSLCLSAAVLQFQDDRAQESASKPQRRLFLLVMRTLNVERRSRALMLLLAVPLLLGFLGLAVLAFFLILLFGSIITALSLPALVADCLLLSLPLLFLAAIMIPKWRRTRKAISLRITRAGEADGFILGELEYASRITPALGYFASIFILYGIQVGVLYCSSDRFGLGGRDGPRGDIIARDFLAPFGFKVEHTNRSAPIFLGFRLGIAILTFFGSSHLYRWFRVQALIQGAPARTRNISELTGWIAQRLDDTVGGPRRFFDEFMFLLLTGEFLQGHYATVDYLSRRLSYLAITPEVRQLFVDPDGVVLLHRSDNT